MKCPHCLEEINDGARVCRFCQHPTPVAMKERAARRANFLWFGVAFVFVVVCGAAVLDYESQQDQLVAAAYRGF